MVWDFANEARRKRIKIGIISLFILVNVGVLLMAGGSEIIGTYLAGLGLGNGIGVILKI
jgi:hypothetical protein